MANSLQKNEQEKLFDELIAVKLILKNKEKEWKQLTSENPELKKVNEELATLRKKIGEIEKNISKYGDSFLDVYDSELMKPLSESDIIVLRDEIKEVRTSLKAISG